MQYTLVLFLIVLTIQLSVAPPVSKDKKDGDEKENEIEEQDEMAAITEYHRYLKEVVQVLESDPDFRAKLEKADEADIRTGKIAHELEFVSHKVRFQLDELKRKELERLRRLAAKENELINGLDYNHLKIAEHLDDANPRTFEIEDLKKLIAKTTQDLAEADRRRRQEFKEYEMQKQFEEAQKMKGNTGMNEEERKKYEAELRAMKEKHKKHEPLHHPGSKQQLEEVWEEQDHMDSQDFDPKTFFHLHDVDSNGLWDQDEVKALFLKELDKLYAEGAPEDDLYERAEEMERMREHVFNEADTNRDGFIDYNEFLEQTKKPDFQQDQGWQALDEQQIYSQQEYEAFEKRRQEEIQKLIAKGMLPPHPDNVPVHQQQFPPQYGNVPPPQGIPPQGYVPPSPAGHPNQVPMQQQQYQGQVPQQQFHQQQAADHQQYQGQVPPQQQIPNQMAQQQQLHGQFAQQQQYQGQVPQQQQQQFQGQVPQQGQPQQGQPQQGQPQQGQPQQQQVNFQQQNNAGHVPVPQNAQQVPQNPQAASIQQQASPNSVPQAVKV